MKSPVKIWILAAMVAAAGAFAAAVQPTAFDYYTDKSETHMIVGAKSPFFYTLYRPAPDTLVVEIPGMDASAFTEQVKAVKSAQVLGAETAVKTTASGDATTVMTLKLAPGTTHSHWMKGTTLYLDLFGDATSEAAAPVSTEAVKSSDVPATLAAENAVASPPPVLEQEDVVDPMEASAKTAAMEEANNAVPVSKTMRALPAAKTLKGVRAENGKIVITGDGALSCESFTLANPARIVVDVLGVTARASVVQGGEGSAYERVRVNQFRVTPDKVARIVLDMKKPMEYSISKQGDSVEVMLGSKMKTAQAEQKAEAVPAPAGAPEYADSGMETAQTTDAGPVVIQPSSQPVPIPIERRATATQPVAMNKDLAPAQFRVSQAPVSKDDTAALDTPEWMKLSATAFETAQADRLDRPMAASSTIGGEVEYKGAPINLNLKDADVKDIFRLFADMSKLNFVLDQAVGGRITIWLHDVPWDQALDIVLKQQNLGKVYQNNVVYIAPVAKLAKEQADKRKLRDERELAEETITRVYHLSYTKSTVVMTLIKQGKLLTKQGQVFDDKRSNILFVTDVPNRVELVEQLIKIVDVSMPQVEIEARIVETTKDYAKGMGITWGASVRADQSHGTSTGLQFPHRIQGDYGVTLPVAGAFSLLDLSLGNVLDTFTLDAQLSMMERHGKGKVLSSPRIVTLNNEKANIENGVQIPYVTTTDLQVNVSFISATLKLDVTPQITSDNTVIMDIAVDKSEPGPVPPGANVPSIITRKAKTQLLVRDGGTAVIGGVFQMSETYSQAQVPGLHRIPLIGWLFKSRTKNTRNDELIIFITPRVQKMEPVS